MALHQIEIPRRARTCAKQGEELKGGTQYVSLLEYDDKGNCLRKDFCEPCWAVEESKEGIYWKSQVPLKNQMPNMKREERALELLKECLAGDDRLPEAFVLSLLLTRTRHLVLRQEIQEGEELLQFYEVKATEEMLVVRKMKLDPKLTEEVKKKLAEQLG